MAINYDDFKKLDIRVGHVKSCERVPKSKSLYKLIVDCGEKKYRQIITGISQFYEIEEILDTNIIILLNLEPKMIMGEQSEGMLLAADIEGKPFLLRVDERESKLIPPGTKIK